ncbi:MAG: ABC transporter substrate-binding protein [Rhodospirillales bacterium 20-64-7]|nr:MAG: ABC transporter substrate-binding protein [Rhodospirillales bacterium 20-64-7]
MAGVLAPEGLRAGGIEAPPDRSGVVLARAHGLAMHGEPELPPDFAHLPYADPSARRGGTLTLGFQGTFDSLNPFNIKAGSTAQGLIGNVFQGLMARNEDEAFSLYPQIVQALEIDDAREHLVFHLDPRARFSDGTPLTSADVRFTFDLFRSKGRPQQRVAYSLVRRLDTPDARTVTYDLTGARDRELPLILALMAVLPKHKVDPATFADSSLAIPTGSGPYRVASVEPGQQLVLERVADWWGDDLPVARGLHNFERIRIEYFRDANALYEAFQSGGLDWREETSPTRWLSGYDFPAIRAGRVRRQSVPIGGPKGLQGFVFNTRRAMFQDVRLREAIGYLFDFEWINAKFYGGLYQRTKSYFDDSILSSVGRPADQRELALLAPFPGTVRADILAGAWRPPVSDGSGRDRAMALKALRLLEAAGWKISGSRMVHAGTGQPLDFEIMISDSSAERLALVFADSMKRLGIRAQVRSVDEVQYQRRRQTFDFDMTIGAWIASASPGNEERGRWSSRAADQPSSFNLAGVRSPAVDAMIEALLAARSQEDFIAAVRVLDRLLLSGFWCVPLFHASDAWIAYSTKLGLPKRIARYSGGAPFGSTLETCWRRDA